MRRKATKSPKNKRKGTKGGGRPRPVGGPVAPTLPPGFDPAALPSDFTAPKLDFSKLRKPDDPR
jgi:signal recognition particle subunit SRP54